MTVIAALEYDGGVIVGCDTFLGFDFCSAPMDRPKWTVHGKVLIGTAGAVRSGQIAESVPLRGKPKKGENDIDFLRRALVEPIRRALHKAGALNAGPHQNTTDLTALIALHGRVYQLDEQLGLSRNACGYNAVGAGTMAAMAAFSATKGTKFSSPEKRMQKVLEASAEHTPFVSGPFYMVNLKA